MEEIDYEDELEQHLSDVERQFTEGEAFTEKKETDKIEKCKSVREVREVAKTFVAEWHMLSERYFSDGNTELKDAPEEFKKRYMEGVEDLVFKEALEQWHYYSILGYKHAILEDCRNNIEKVAAGLREWRDSYKLKFTEDQWKDLLRLCLRFRFPL